MAIPASIGTGGHAHDPEITDMQKAVIALLAAFSAGLLKTANGGLGLGAYVQGDLLYASAANVLAALAKGTAGQILTQGATVPSWAGDTAWTAPTLLNGWTNFGAGWQPAGYFKDSSGVVHIRGVVNNVVGTAAANAIFTMPAGYRPANRTPFVSWNMQTAVSGRIDVDAAGNVFNNAATAANDLFTINGLTVDTR